MEGRFLSESSLADLRAAVTSAEDEGIDAVFIGDGPLGDAVALAAAIGTWSRELLIGIRAAYGGTDRHPSLMARELSTLDLILHARAVVAISGPFSKDAAEVVALWRAMWRDGVAPLGGPDFPVAGAVNRPLPQRPGGPLIALDLTDGPRPADAVLDLGDLVLVAADSTLPALPPRLDVCQIQNA